MAAGVPVVAENRFGWPEMIRHGETGLLCDTPADFTAALARLAADEPYRMQLAENARRAVEAMADPALLGRQWRELFEKVGTEP
jgi:glycosyltransferase involved in cell wall biosynthesis